MNEYLNAYLDKVDRYLKTMPASERADIINEIKSEMVELETQDQLTPGQEACLFCRLQAFWVWVLCFPEFLHLLQGWSKRLVI